MDTTAAYKRVRNTLIAERSMRQRVFENNPAKMTEKVTEINEALEALDELHEKAKGAEQPGLFDGNL